METNPTIVISMVSIGDFNLHTLMWDNLPNTQPFTTNNGNRQHSGEGAGYIGETDNGDGSPGRTAYPGILLVKVLVAERPGQTGLGC